MPVEYQVDGNVDRTVAGVPIRQPRKVMLLAAATTLGLEDNNAIVCFNAAAGFTITLPVPGPGLHYEFRVTVSATSSAHKVITPTGVFLLGHFTQSTDGTFVEAWHAANGTTIRSWNGNGSTTGGLIADWFVLDGINATQYLIIGKGSATGTEATPFATS